MVHKRLLLFLLAAGLLAALAAGGWLAARQREATIGYTTDADTDKLELTIMIDRSADADLPPPERDFIRRAIEAKFGVRLNMTAMPPGAEFRTEFVGKFMANDPPDMGIELGEDGGSQMILDGVYADLTPFLSPATMPNYFRFWISERELKQYQLHNRFARAPVPYDRNSYRSYYIRKDWLDRLKLDVPQTYGQYAATLRAFTFGDPDGDGRADTYGFTTFGNGSRLSDEWPEFVKNGLLYPDYMENNRLVDMASDIRVGQVADDILALMREGVVDPDWFLNQEGEHIDKAVQGKAGVVMGTTLDFAFDANPQSLQSRSRSIDPSAEWIAFNPFGPDQPLGTAVESGLPFVVSKLAADRQPEKVRKLLEILDWLCGEEGFLLTHYGIEGKHYAKSGDTITLLTPASDGSSAFEADALRIWDFFTPESPSVLGLKVVDPRLTEHDRAVEQTLRRIPVKEKLGAFLVPPLEIDVGAFRNRQNELHIKMLFSDKSGSRWPEYRRELMEQYNGEHILRYYENQVRAARGTE